MRADIFSNRMQASGRTCLERKTEVKLLLISDPSADARPKAAQSGLPDQKFTIITMKPGRHSRGFCTLLRLSGFENH